MRSHNYAGIVVGVVATPPLTRHGGMAQTEIQVHAVSLIELG